MKSSRSSRTRWVSGIVLLLVLLCTQSGRGQSTEGTQYQQKMREGCCSTATPERHYNVQMRASYIGAGGLVLADRYLSPLSYGGYTLSMQHERARYLYRTPEGCAPSLWARLSGSAPRTENRRWLWHSFISGDYSSTTNPAGNASIMRLQGRFDTSWLYQLYSGRWGQLGVGPGYTLGIGGLYSSRNGNNPATLKLDQSLTLSMHYSYRLPWVSFPLLVRLSSRTDLLGMQFAQQYGESYYEMLYVSQSLGKNLALSHLGNQLGQQLRLSLDVPLWDRGIVSLSYRLQHRAWRVHQVFNRQTDHTLSIGLVRYIQPRGGRSLLSGRSVALPF